MVWVSVMNYTCIEELEKELEEFKKEKERVRNIVGKIGGSNNVSHKKNINILFLSIVVAVFFHRVGYFIKYRLHFQLKLVCFWLH